MNASDLRNLETVAAPLISGKPIGEIIFGLTKYIFAAAGMLLLLYLIMGGFSYLTSAGDPQNIEAAKGKITNALLGFVIVFFAYIIVRAIAVLFNIEPILEIFQ